ncbi:MAG: hypothetical protein KAR13_15940 [Desulfobulbaceae bacterium]|nr:hypothetical protein [Desulfobulbaceae bacterium]
MTTETSKREVIDHVLSKVFDEALFSDLETMLGIPEGLDFGIIALVSSGIDLLGSLEQGHMGKSSKRFKKALGLYFPENGYKECKNFFYDLFRCGVAHQAFLKPGGATARNPDYEDYHLKRIYIEGENESVVFLHPNVFAKHFFQAVKKFKSTLDESEKAVDNAYAAILQIYDHAPKPDPSIEIYKTIPLSNQEGKVSVTKMPLPVVLSPSNVLPF